jgi:hypothetical protein
MVLVLAVLTGDSIAQLLQALGPDAELLCNRLLGRIVSKKNEGLKGGVRVALLVNAPQDMVEEGSKIDGYRALDGLIDAGDLVAVASGAIRRLLDGGER